MGYNKSWGNPTTPKAIKSPTLKDLYWAAGFLEGEGSFRAYPTSSIIEAAQAYEFRPLYKLQRMFGGAVSRKYRTCGYSKDKDSYHVRWRACGGRARGIMLTLFHLMSPRRQEQIKTHSFRRNK